MQSLIQQLVKCPTDSGHAELDTLLAELIPLFLDGDPETHSQVRNAVAGDRKLEDHIRTYAARAAISLHRNPDGDMFADAGTSRAVIARDNDELFRLGLGALAIEDCADYRESMTVLAELCIRGEQAGVIPRRHLEQLAHIFSDKLVGGFGNQERPYKVVVRDYRKTK